MNKSHATIFLVRLLGESDDGGWTEEKMKSVLSLWYLSSALEEAPDWADKIRSLELNETSAIDILNQESKGEQMQCLLSVLLAACSDGVVDDGEQNVLARIMAKLNKGITVDELVEARRAYLDGFKMLFKKF